MRSLLLDMSNTKNTQPDELTNKLITNIHQLFSSLPCHSRVRPAMLAILTAGLSPQDASRITGYSNSAISYARREGFIPFEV